MSILINNNSRIVVQGITGKYGRQQVKLMINSGTQILAGVSPGKGGENVHGIPVYDLMEDVVKKHSCDTSVVYVPPSGVKEAVIEAIDCHIKVILVATENVPILDAMFIKEYAKKHDCWIIGPNTAGIINPGEILLGSIAPEFTSPGQVGLITQSGSVVNEVSSLLTDHGIGQSSCVDIGGDLIIGRNIKEYLYLFENDPETKAIILVGEIGGKLEYEAGEYIKTMTKPVLSYIVGSHVPPGQQMGHVGALISEESEGAQAKMNFLKKCGAETTDSLWEIPKLIQKYI